MARILVTHGVPAKRFRLLAPDEVVCPADGRAFSREKLLALLPGCDAVVACGALDRELLAVGQKLKLVVVYGAGYDAVDMAAATELGIPVCNIPDSVTEATAQLAVTLMLTLLRGVCGLNKQLHRANAPAGLFTMGRNMGVSPEGLTLGVVGMGRIGARVAEYARFLHMRVVYTSREIKPFSVAGHARRLPLAELLRTADVVTLHCPLTPETRQLINRKTLTLMKPTAFLINTARGKVVDSAALAAALEAGRLAGAALDVFENEPEVSGRLKALDNVILTPHVGSNTLRTRNGMAEQCTLRIREALAGRRPQNLLNPEVWPEEPEQAAEPKPAGRPECM